MGFASNIFGQLQEARSLGHQSRMTRIEGQAQKDEAYRAADATERESRANAELAGLQMRQTREVQRQAVGQARNARAAAGFDMTQGSGAQAIADVSGSYDSQIDNMALSSSLEQANAINQATNLRQAGANANLSANLQADLIRDRAKAIRTSTWFTGMSAAAGFAAGGINGADMFSSFTNSMNPYTSKHVTEDWDKKLAALLTGN